MCSGNPTEPLFVSKDLLMTDAFPMMTQQN